MQNDRPEHIPGYCSETVLGIVTNIQDPEKRGRIKVKMPRFGDQEYPLWCDPRGVCLAPRGARTRAKGRVLRPALDAAVYITFLDGDMHAPLWEPGSFPRDKQPVEAAENPRREVIYSSDKGNAVTENDRGDMALTVHNGRDLAISTRNGHLKAEANTMLLNSTLDGPNAAREGDQVDVGSLTITWALAPGGGTIMVQWNPPAGITDPSITPVIVPAAPSGTATISLVGRISQGEPTVKIGQPAST
jgi:hypothetical protein